MPVTQYSVLVNATDPDFTLKHLDAVVDGDLLVLKMKNEVWNPPTNFLLPCLEENQRKDQKSIEKAKLENEKQKSFSLQIEKLIGYDLYKYKSLDED